MKKHVIYQLVSKEEVLSGTARVHYAVGTGDGEKLAIDMLRYELTRAKGNTCFDCHIKNPVVRKVTIEEAFEE